ncbi:MAG: hypothetical protein IKI95_03720 [Clostridia bacterium]|nr:hypothetical protein [Clostridia bacterium]
MENVQIVKETISSLNPVACGNSRSCYHVDDRVVLVETASSSTYEKALKAQEYTNLLQSKGVNTARIENLFFDEGKLYWVEDKLMGHPVYFRNEKSFCLSKGLELPASEIKINSRLKDEFFKLNDLSISDYFTMSLSQRREFESKCNEYIEGRIQSDPELKSAFEYSQQIKAQVKAQNQAFAESYLQADQTHFDRFLSDLITVFSYHRGVDCHSDNFLYDDKAGFSLIDLAIPQQIIQSELTEDDLCIATGYMIDILTRGTADPETQQGIVDRCFASAENLGIDLEDKNVYLPPELKQSLSQPNSAPVTTTTQNTEQ